jgi:ATP-dependent Lon protease
MEQVELHTFFLKKKVLFPFCTLTISISPTEGVREIRKNDRVLAVPIRTSLDLLRPRNRMATLSEVTDVRTDLGTLKISMKGLMRVKITGIVSFRKARFETLEPAAVGQHDSISDELRKKSQELIFLINVEESDKLINLLNYIFDLNQMTDFISNYFILDFRARRRLYNEPDINRRSRMLVEELTALINRLTRKRKKKAL